MERFNYFQNEEGTFTIQYGYEDSIITGGEKKEKDAIESCKRLNSIMKEQGILFGHYLRTIQQMGEIVCLNGEKRETEKVSMEEIWNLYTPKTVNS